MHLSRQLGAFIRAGLPLIDAIRALGEEASNAEVRRVLGDLGNGLRRGEPLSDCVDRHPNVFPEFYRGILRSAELTGQLDTVLEQLARYLERDIDARRKVTSALIYPVIIAVAATITVVVLAVGVLPRFKPFFASLTTPDGHPAKLPWSTRALLAATDFVGHWWWAVLVGAGILVGGALVALATEGGRYAKDRLALKTPVLGQTVWFILVERFCRILAAMASAGVSLPDALRVASGSLRNRVFMRSLNLVGEAMLQGEGLARPLASTGLFPATAVRMMRVGEETGTLDNQLEVTARYYEGELDYRIKKMTALFEPLVIVVMGLIVGFVALALIQAMYGIFGQVHP
jgi:type IV pilus assembly protein PilC